MRPKKTPNELKEREIRVLIRLSKEPPGSGLGFDKLKSEISISRDCLSGYIKHLYKLKLVTKDIDSRNYSITRLGRDRLDKETGLKNIEFSSVTFDNNIPMEFPSKSVSLSDSTFPIVYSDKRAVVNGYLYIDGIAQERVRSIARRIEKSSETYFASFFFDLGNAVAAERGIDTSIQLGKPPVPKFEGWVEEEKASLDYYAAVLLIFKGNELSAKINWDTLAAEARADRQRHQERFEEIRNRISSDPTYAKETVEDMIRSTIGYLNMRHIDSEELVESKLVETILKFHGDLLGDNGGELIRLIFADMKKRDIIAVRRECYVYSNEGTSGKKSASTNKMRDATLDALRREIEKC